MASSIVVPTPGYVPQAIISLATQAKQDAEALEQSVGSAVTAETVGSALAQSGNPIPINSQPLTSVGGIVFVGSFTSAISCAEAATTTHDLTIDGQSLNAEQSGNGGGVKIRSGAKAGAGVDGDITLDSRTRYTYMRSGDAVGNTFSFIGSTAGTGTCTLNMLQDDATIAASTAFTLSAGGASLLKAEANKLGFFGGAAVVKPDVTGIRGTNVGLTNLLTALAGLGLITDSTTES